MKKTIYPLILLLLAVLFSMGCSTAGQHYYSDSDPGEPLFQDDYPWPSPHGF